MNKTIIVDNDIKLQEITMEDIEDIFNTINNEREYLGNLFLFVENIKTIEDAKKDIGNMIKKSASLNEYIFTIKFKDNFVGIIRMKNTKHENKKTEIGYWLAQKYQKKGIVTKSLIKFTEFIFKDLNLNRIEIKCTCGNLPSISIPKRLGYVFEGIERDGRLLNSGFADVEIYSLLKNEWTKHKI